MHHLEGGGFGEESWCFRRDFHIYSREMCVAVEGNPGLRAVVLGLRQRFTERWSFPTWGSWVMLGSLWGRCRSLECGLWRCLRI